MASIVLKRKRSIKDSERINRRVIEGKVKDTAQKVEDAEDDEVVEEPKTTTPGLTPEDVTALLELLPYKDALIKIARGEFEIEKIVEEDDEEVEEDLGEDGDLGEDFGEDEDGTEIEEDDEYVEEDEVEDYSEEDEDVEVEDSALQDSEEINDAWKKRLCGQKD